LFEAPELSNLALGFFLSSRSGQRFGNSLALLFVSQARGWAVNRLARLVTVTVGLAATTAGIGDGSAAEIAKAGQLLDDFGTTRFQI
jgi:hypothetical protein